MINASIIEGVILLISFSITIAFFKIEGFLSGSGSLPSLLVFPLLFYMPSFFSSITKNSGVLRSGLLYALFLQSARGTGAGLSIMTGEILHQWYLNPDNGQLEPLFTAMGLTSAAVVSAAAALGKRGADD